MTEPNANLAAAKQPLSEAEMTADELPCWACGGPGLNPALLTQMPDGTWVGFRLHGACARSNRNEGGAAHER